MHVTLSFHSCLKNYFYNSPGRDVRRGRSIKLLVTVRDSQSALMEGEVCGPRLRACESRCSNDINKTYQISSSLQRRPKTTTFRPYLSVDRWGQSSNTRARASYGVERLQVIHLERFGASRTVQDYLRIIHSHIRSTIDQ